MEPLLIYLHCNCTVSVAKNSGAKWITVDRVFNQPDILNKCHPFYSPHFNNSPVTFDLSPLTVRLIVEQVHVYCKP